MTAIPPKFDFLQFFCHQQKIGKYAAGAGNRYPRDEVDARLKLFSKKDTSK